MAGGLMTITFAQIFTAGALLLVALSFATDHWIEITVDRPALKTLAASNPALNTSLYSDPVYYTRNRGLFRTCFEGSDLFFLATMLNQVVDGRCLVQGGYELQQNLATVSWGQDYETRKHLMRSHVAMFIVGMLMLVIGCVCGAVGCWGMRPMYLRAAGILVFVAAFVIAGGMAFFHGYDYLEKEKINQPPFPARWNVAPLQTNHVSTLGYSYILGWLSMGLATVAAILFLCVAFSTASMEGEEFEKVRKRGRSNPAYQFMDYGPPMTNDYPTYGGPGTAYPPTQYVTQDAIIPVDYAYRY